MLKLAKFWAAWCGPCKQIGPIIDKIEQDYKDKGLVVEKINIDEDKELAAKHNVMSIPTLIFFKDDEIVEQLVGLVPESEIRSVIDKHL